MKKKIPVEVPVLLFFLVCVMIFIISQLHPEYFDVFWRRENPEMLASDISPNSVILVNNNQPVDQLSAYLLSLHTGSKIQYLPDYVNQSFVQGIQREDYDQIILLGYSTRRLHYLEDLNPILIRDRTLSATNRLVNRMIWPSGTHFEKVYIAPVNGTIDMLNALPLIKKEKAPLFLFINENWLPSEVDEYTFDETILLGANVPMAYKTLPNITQIGGESRWETSENFFKTFYDEDKETLLMNGTSFYTDFQKILKFNPEQVRFKKPRPQPPLY